MVVAAIKCRAGNVRLRAACIWPFEPRAKQINARFFLMLIANVFVKTAKMNRAENLYLR